MRQQRAKPPSEIVQLLVLLTVLAVNVWPQVKALDGSAAWSQYKLEFNKIYSDPQEEALRRELFTAELRRVQSHNSNTSASFQLGLNHMSDWTEAEFKQLLSADAATEPELEPRFIGLDPFVSEILNQAKGPAPKEFDWRQVWPRQIGAVKQQGDCAFGWAFATTALLEAQQMGRLNMSRVVPLSEQQLLDCGRQRSCRGAGGLVSLALEDIAKWNGLMSDHDYPYRGSVQKKCLVNDKLAILKKVKGYAVLRSWDEEEMKKVLHRYGPVAVRVASCSWNNYRSGVLPVSMCEGPFDHWALIVGYGHDCRSGLDYWTVQNSWGSGHGEGGYIRIERNKNACRIADMPIIAKFKP